MTELKRFFASDAKAQSIISQKKIIEEKTSTILAGVYDEIEVAAKEGFYSIQVHLLEKGLKGISNAGKIRDNVLEDLNKSGYTLEKGDPWIAKISWEK
jgi:RNA binding exosome subunit